MSLCVSVWICGSEIENHCFFVFFMLLFFGGFFVFMSVPVCVGVCVSEKEREKKGKTVQQYE